MKKKIKVYSKDGYWRVDFPNRTGVVLATCHGVTPIEKIWFSVGVACAVWYDGPYKFEDVEITLLGEPREETKE